MIFAFGAAANHAFTQAPQNPTTPAPAEPTLLDPMAKDFATSYGLRPVAYIYGNEMVSRAELAEFLIARGGYEKVELLVNKKIIEREALKRNITVTPQEMEYALEEDLKITNPPIQRKDFVNIVLPKYGKTLYEWMEDVVRPRLLLSKMCRDRVKVTDEDLKVGFERMYGEKREAQMIIFPKGDDPKTMYQLWDKIRKNDAEFQRAARTQANPALAANEGRVTIGRHNQGSEKIVEEKVFQMEENEVSGLLETSQGTIVLKLVRKVPANAKVKLEGQVKDALYKEVFDLKLTNEIPKQFQELAGVAKPNILLSGPPSQWKFEQTNRQMAEDFQRQQQPGQPQSGVQPAGGTAPKK